MLAREPGFEFINLNFVGHPFPNRTLPPAHLLLNGTSRQLRSWWEATGDAHERVVEAWEQLRAQLVRSAPRFTVHHHHEVPGLALALPAVIEPLRVGLAAKGCALRLGLVLRAPEPYARSLAQYYLTAGLTEGFTAGLAAPRSIEARAAAPPCAGAVAKSSSSAATVAAAATAAVMTMPRTPGSAAPCSASVDMAAVAALEQVAALDNPLCTYLLWNRWGRVGPKSGYALPAATGRPRAWGALAAGAEVGDVVGGPMPVCDDRLARGVLSRVDVVGDLDGDLGGGGLGAFWACAAALMGWRSDSSHLPHLMASSPAATFYSNTTAGGQWGPRHPLTTLTVRESAALAAVARNAAVDTALLRDFGGGPSTSTCPRGG